MCALFVYIYTEVNLLMMDINMATSVTSLVVRSLLQSSKANNVIIFIVTNLQRMLLGHSSLKNRTMNE